MLAFTVGALLPLLTSPSPARRRGSAVTVGSVAAALALTGYVSARIGQADPRRAVLRNVGGGLLAMPVTLPDRPGGRHADRLSDSATRACVVRDVAAEPVRPRAVSAARRAGGRSGGSAHRRGRSARSPAAPSPVIRSARRRPMLRSPSSTSRPVRSASERTQQAPQLDAVPPRQERQVRGHHRQRTRRSLDLGDDRDPRLVAHQGRQPVARPAVGHRHGRRRPAAPSASP